MTGERRGKARPPPDVQPRVAAVHEIKVEKKKTTGTKFVERTSKLDLAIEEPEKHEWRGWYNLGILSAFFLGVTTVMQNISRLGTLVTTKLFVTAITDLPVLILADLAMISFITTAFFLQKLIVCGVVSRGLGIILQHALQTTLFIYSLSFIFYRDFPWIQSGSFVMHTIVLFMKMHSYLQSNRDLADMSPPSPLYPKNVSLKNFLLYLVFPTLVYEPEYPRSRHVRPGYLFEKIIGFTGTFCLMYICTENFILPVVAKLNEISFFEAMSQLLLPFTLMHLWVFYIIFESICNVFAEVSLFADRQFYEDWWNSVTFDEYARKWNKPVHEWLLRHVYIESMQTYKLSRRSATFATFLFSSLLHELVMAVTTKKIRFFFFACQLLQIPFIQIGRHKFFRDRPRLGNFFIWFSLLSGPPMFCVLYIVF